MTFSMLTLVPWWGIIIIVFGSLLVLALLLYLVAGIIIWRKTIVTSKPEKYRNKPTTDKVVLSLREYRARIVKHLESLNMESIYIKSRDGLALHAYFMKSLSGSKKVVISVHGYRGDAFDTSAKFSHFLTDYDYNILFIDLRSYGKSEGKYTTYGVKDRLDLLDWIDYLKDRFEGDIEIALFGISMGAFTTLSISDRVPKEVKCIIADSSYTSPIEEFKYCLKSIKQPKMLVYSSEFINLLVCHFNYRLNTKKILKNAKVPILFIHGAEDDFVPTYMSKENYDACTSEKKLVLFKGKGHARCFFFNKEEYKSLVLDYLIQNL